MCSKIGVELMKNSFKKVYHYLFEYDNDKLSIYNQYYSEILSTLEFALLHHAFVLLSYQDGSSEIGQITKQISPGKFVLSSMNKKLLRIIDLDTIFRVDLA